MVQRDPADVARIAELEAKLAWALERITVLEAQVARLTAQLSQNSTNSSKPPSSDPPGLERKAKAPSGRKPGGQPGHQRNVRNLVPVERVDVLEELVPRSCRRCHHHLRGRDPHPLRHQVTEVPVVAPTVTEYQLHALVCPGCGEVTGAELPDGVPRGPSARCWCRRLLAQVEYAGTQVYEYFAHLDHLGTPRALSNRNGQVVWSTYQRPYGEVLERTVVDPVAGRTVVTNVRLPGQYDERLLGSLGLQGPYYNWNRWYLPGVGRYMELDPAAYPRSGWLDGESVRVSSIIEAAIRSPWELSLYAYARGNPLGATDPSGEGNADRIKCVYYLYKCAKEIELCRAKAPTCDPEKDPDVGTTMGGLSRDQLKACMKDSPCIEKMLKACAGAS